MSEANPPAQVPDAQAKTPEVQAKAVPGGEPEKQSKTDIGTHPQPAKAESPAKKEKATKTAFDHFVLESVFKSPRTVFSECTPRLKDLYADCLFVLDTNVLMAPYKLGSGQAEDIGQLYKGLADKDRLFVPVRAAQEFARNRTNLMKDLYAALIEWDSKLPSVPSLDKVQCPMLEQRPEYKRLVSASKNLSAARKEYAQSLRGLMQDLTDWSWDDPISQLYKDLFVESRIITHDKQREEVLELLEYRNAHKLPPGYKDGGKPDDGIGDILIWLSIVKLGKDRKSNILFVCNEEKPDWIVRTNNTVLTVRTELSYEFFSETGFHFGFLNFPYFLSLLGAKQETVERAKNLEVDDLKFARIQEGVDRTLQLIADIISTFVGSDRSTFADYHLIEDRTFASSVSRFRSLRRQYNAIIHSPTGSTLLAELEDILEEVEYLNGMLLHMQARMKREGEQESIALLHRCGQFLKKHDQWLEWRLSGSPDPAP